VAERVAKYPPFGASESVRRSEPSGIADSVIMCSERYTDLGISAQLTKVG
jgi:hypothetical protein